MFTYSLKKMAIQCVRMLITPMPAVFQQAGTMQDQVKFLALHPKFHQPGNNFVIIQDKTKAISVCKARFDPAHQTDPRTVITIPRIVHGVNKLEVFVTKNDGIMTC